MDTLNPPPTPPQSLRWLWLAAAAVLVADQASKYYVVQVLRLDRLGALDVLPPLLNLRMAWNTGMNFGLLSSESDLGRWILIAVALAISLWVWRWMSQARPGTRGLAAAGLLIGGAIGNVVDRLVYGAVADFINMSCCGLQNPFSFNVADISIFAGALGLVLFGAPKNTP